MSLIRHTLAALVLGGCALVAQAVPQRYTIVSKISRVSFQLEHQGFIQLLGTLRVSPGSFLFDPEDWSRSEVMVTMPVPSLDMGDAIWNRQIRGDSEWARLFKTRDIGFRSTRLTRVDESHGTLDGTLTLAGVTRPVSLSVQINKLGRNEVSERASVGFSARTVIKRSDFGLDAYSDLVGDELTVQIQLEAALGPDDDASHDLRALGVARGR